MDFVRHTVGQIRSFYRIMEVFMNAVLSKNVMDVLSFVQSSLTVASPLSLRERQWNPCEDCSYNCAGSCANRCGGNCQGGLAGR